MCLKMQHTLIRWAVSLRTSWNIFALGGILNIFHKLRVAKDHKALARV